MKKLLLRARAGRMLPNFQAHDGGLRRYIGRQHDPKLGVNGGWPMTEKPEEVVCDGERELEYLAAYRAAAKDGDCWPADEATARILGVKFDPDFGGDEEESHPHAVKGE